MTSPSHLQAEVGREELPVWEREREEREGRRERREEQGPVRELQFKVQPDTDNLEGKWFNFLSNSQVSFGAKDEPHTL